MRKLLLLLTVVTVGLLFIARLLYLQVYNKEAYSIFDDTAIRSVYDYPKRGYVYDRHGNLLVANQPSYDVMVIPREVEPLDEETLLEFCSLLKITEEEYHKKLERANNYSPRLPSPFVPQLSKEDYAVLQEKMRKYEGFYIQKRSLRAYQTSIGANVLGDIGEVNQRNIANDPYYRMGDLIGKQGIELSYEDVLRGVKGIKFIQKDRFNKNIGPYKEGRFDTLPQPGKDITITIDSQLQQYGELLMTNKRGGIVAIDPKNGEILALVTGPSYNPNLLVGRERNKNFSRLFLDTISRPTFDRGLQAQYPPGSPFKVINALIGLQEGVVKTSDMVSCRMGYYYGSRKLTGCHHHKSPVDMNEGIAQSCNAYFVNIYRRIIDKYDDAGDAMNKWAVHAKSFGLGNYLGYDLPVGQRGRIPDGNYYDRAYGDNRWGSTYIVSNAIGQGEVEATPIQLANMAAAIGNRGYYYTPHIIKSIEGDTIPSKYTTRKETTIDKRHFEPVIEGMFDVYNKGTAATLRIPGIDICGKTGTAENFVRIDGEKTQLTDHSIFVAFAPKDDPKIAIAVFVENGYWGSRFAGRMTSLMIEKYIKGTITRTDLEDWILTHSLEEEYAKPYSGEPFKINGETTLQIIDKVQSSQESDLDSSVRIEPASNRN
ncbi:penicillin-binding protein 2 [Psychroserpens sp.]|uniref:penicillin-binding protein 2 n=1 Tax=Psychroserpens sp. TaxID=2020870 RepID=UPI001B270DD3|nr:penicillin-binding protein 2 [Psychroserpens sp.]MBO6605968.1 penicillin-binding protein 2 [Psychroserpens sp.]MBO6630896.1 penicillin-binding protein 2 [Psychroserpens sp.]MBO6652661.1 penicillin-binding protein 2 [Psychroserpens sp.]MBO6681567.1 penicillin-binding protein 2 [Psychroserpens sp.]MBO6749342.1 penicillin-binding protein 2 [Psychroserpens sp.]